MISAADVRKHTVASMVNVPVASPSDKFKHGNNFYKYFFTHHPDVRKYFIGAENYTADDVAKSERFDKQGNAILLAVHILTETYDNEHVFRGFCRDVINRHIERHLDPALWKQFCSIWVDWLESEGVQLTAEQKAAWNTLSITFNEECQKHLAAIGQPHL